MRLIINFLTFLLLFLLTACATSTFGIDSGIFSEQPCKAPCWQNLTPGQSTSAEVDRFIDSLNIEEWPGKYVFSYESGCNYIRISDKAGDYVNAAVEFHVENEKLTFIQSSQPNLPTLGQVVDHIGPPEYIKAILVTGHEVEAYFLDVFYPKKGLAFLVSTEEEEIGYIKSTMTIHAIQYFSPGDLQSYFTVVDSCNLGQENAAENAKDTIAKYVQSWPGFGAVNVIPGR